MVAARLFRFIVVFALSLAGVASEAAPAPELVKQLHETRLGSYPENFTAVGSTLFFSALDGTHGRELWKSDGTESGTELVKDLVAGAGSAQIDYFTAVGETLYFVANRDSTGESDFWRWRGTELWKSDGTEVGTVMIKEISGAEYANGFDFLTAVGNTLYFRATNGTNQQALWKSDGTEVGTVMVKEFAVGSGGGEIDNLTVFGDSLYFRATDETHGAELWKSDGTEAGTVMVKDVRAGTDGSSPTFLKAVGSTLYFSANDGVNGAELWRSDGTEAGTVLVKDIRTGADSGFPRSFAVAGDTLYFRANDGLKGTELWRSDGTAEGTVMVKDIRTGAEDGLYSYAADPIVAVGSTLFFQANDGVNGFELWKSDGTAAGTVLVKDITEGLPYSSFHFFSGVGNALYFLVGDSVIGKKLWKSDGTVAGTVLVKNINVGANSSDSSEFAVADGAIYFAAGDGLTEKELWKSDGTEVGTVLVKDINAVNIDVDLGTFTAVGSALYFPADDGTHGKELWKSNGTAAGTVLLKDIHPGVGSSHPGWFRVVRDNLYFSAESDTNGRELWKSDGTAEGTVMVKDIAPGSESSLPFGLGALGNTLYFQADNGTNGRELWKTNGTESGTVLVKDILSGVGSSNPGALSVVGKILYFQADDGVNRSRSAIKIIGGFVAPYENRSELWKSNGTASGTVMVNGCRNPREITVVGSSIYFQAENEYGAELWKSDGTSAGTMMLKNIQEGSYGSDPTNFTPVGNVIFFRALNSTHGAELWKSDGTEAGTVLVKDIYAGTGSSNPKSLTVVGDTLYFVADDGIHRAGLWKSDGTEAGTVLIKDVHVEVESNDLSFSGFARNPIKIMGGMLFFSANDGIHGEELWQSDGTPAGTVMVKDLTGDSGGSRPHNFCAVDGKLFFVARTEALGSALYIFDPNGNPNPTVTLNGPNPAVIEASAGSFTDAGATARDIVEGYLPPTITASNVNPAVPGVYQLTWTATDRNGFTGSAIRQVIVRDTTPPKVSGTFSPLSIPSGTSLPDYTTQAIATDLVGVVSLSQFPLPGTIVAGGSVRLTIVAKDSAGNENSTGFTIGVTGAPAKIGVRLGSIGSDVPGAGIDSRIQSGAIWFGRHGIPAINDAGAVAFIGKWIAPGIPGISPAQFGTGIFIDDTLVVAEGDPVPGAGAADIPVDAKFRSFRDPVIDEVGHVAFLAEINGTGTRSTNNTVVVSSGRAGSLEVLAREGSEAPGTGGAKFKQFTSVSIQGCPHGGTIFTASLKHASGSPKVTQSNESGAWWLPAGESAVLKLAREGDPGFEVGEKIRSFLVLNPLSGSPGHGRGQIDGDRALIWLALAGGDRPRQAQVLAEPGTLTEIASTGDLLGSDKFPSAQWATMSLPSSGAQGARISVLGSLTTGIGGVTRADAKGIFLSDDRGATWEPLVRIGDNAPGLGGEVKFSDLRDPVHSSTDASVAFLSTVKGGAVRSSNNSTLWWKPDGGTLTLIAREGETLTAGTVGAKWRSFTSVAMPGGAVGPIFTATLQHGMNGQLGPGGVAARNAIALYAVDSSGNLRELMREHYPLPQNVEQDLGVVERFRVLKAVSGSAGVTRAFNANRQIVAWVTFADGMDSIVKFDVP